jgi:predicted transcriptional regulator
MKIHLEESEMQALALLVAKPGQLDAEAIGQALWRPRITSTATYLSVRRAILANGAQWSRDASEIIHRLVEAGLVEKQRPPQVAQRWEKLARRSPAETIAEAVQDEPNPDPTGLKAELLGRLVARKKPQSMEEWIGDAPAGNVQRAVVKLVEWGLVVPPGYRWPTKAGIAAVKAAVPKLPTHAQKCVDRMVA